MELKVDITPTRIVLVLAILSVGGISGWLFAQGDNQNIAIQGYTAGGFAVINEVTQNGQKEYCDTNKNCVRLYEEKFIIKSLGLDKNQQAN